MMYLGDKAVGANNSSIKIIDNAMPEWEYINTIQVSEDTDTIMCSSDYAGNPISLRGFAIFIYCAPSANVTANANLYIGLVPRLESFGTSTTYEVVTITAGIRSSAQQNFCWGMINGIINDSRNNTPETDINYITSLVSIGGTTDSGGGKKGAITVAKTVGDGYIHAVYAQGKYFGPGSFIRVYGIKTQQGGDV